MESSSKLTLKPINGLDPEACIKMQDAEEKKVRDKSRKQHLLYAVFVGLMMIFASTLMQYTLAVVVTVCGWTFLWFSQEIPFGMDGGLPRTRGLPPVFGLLLLLALLVAVTTFCIFTYSVATTHL